MTRLALSCIGLGWTLGIATIALVGENATVSLSFSAGVMSAVIVVLLAGIAIGYVLKPQVVIPPDERRSVEL